MREEWAWGSDAFLNQKKSREASVQERKGVLDLCRPPQWEDCPNGLKQGFVLQGGFFFFSLKGSNVIVWCLLIRAKRILSPIEALKNICSKIQFLSKQTKACSTLTIIPSMSSALFQVLVLKKREKSQHLTFFPPSPQLLNIFTSSPLPPHPQTGCLHCHVRGCSSELTAPSSKLRSWWVAGAAPFSILNFLISWLKREKRKSRLWLSSQPCHFLTLSQSHELLMSIFPSVKPHKDVVKQN